MRLFVWLAVRTHASLAACLVSQMAGLPASFLLIPCLPSAVPPSRIFPAHRGRERERGRQRARERETVLGSQSCLKGFRMADLLRDCLAGRLLTWLAGLLVGVAHRWLAGPPGWMLGYFATCMRACLSPPLAEIVESQRACLSRSPRPSEQETGARDTLREREERV